MSGFNTIPPNPFPPSTDEDGTQAAQIKHLQEDVSALQGNVTTLTTTKANQATIAPSFSAETSYSVGDIVYYNGLTYRCTNAHEGAWDADDFAAITIANELDELKSGLTNKVSRFAIAEITAQSMDEFVLGVINAISNDIGVGEIAVVNAIYPNVNYFMFTVLNFEGVNYMFAANNTTAMYFGTVNTSTSSVSLYSVTATAQ